MKRILLSCLVSSSFLNFAGNSYATLPDNKEADAKMAEFLASVCGNAGNFCNPVWWEKATIEDVQAELNAGHDINQIDPQGNTPLMSAIISKADLNIISFLVENGADINYKSSKGKSILELALNRFDIVEFLISKGVFVEPDILVKNLNACENSNVLDILLKHGAKIDAKGEFGETLLKRVSHYAKLEVIESLIEHNADIRAKNEFGETVIMSAIRNQNPRVTGLLLARGADQDINAVSDFWGETALMMASSAQSPEIIKLLLDYGADVNLKNNKGETALMKAVNNPDILPMLIEAGAKVNEIDNRGENALVKAHRLGKQAAIDILAKQNINMNVKDEKGTPALMLAYMQAESVKQMLDLGANPNIRDAKGNTALMKATYPVQFESIKYLLEAGANPNLINIDGKTPLMIQYSDAKAVELLIKHGAEVNAQDLSGNTPLYFTIIFNYIDSMKVLLENGANPNIATYHGVTPLMAAAVNGRTEMVKLLLEKGADQTLNVKDNKGETAMDKAQLTEIIDILKQAQVKTPTDIHSETPEDQQ